jgi:hypothetical protein
MTLHKFGFKYRMPSKVRLRFAIAAESETQAIHTKENLNLTH